MQIFKSYDFVKKGKLVNFSIWWGFREIGNFPHCCYELKWVKQCWRAFWQDLLKMYIPYAFLLHIYPTETFGHLQKRHI